MKKIKTVELCEYGCGQIAQYELSNGKKCCSKSANSCQVMKRKNANSHVEDKECPYCHVKFIQINSRVFANHVRWCKKNPKHDEICGKPFTQKLQKASKQLVNKRHGELKTYEVECKTCHKKFQVQEFEKDFPSKDRYFCSRSCANSYSAKQVKGENISLGRKQFDKTHLGYWTKDHIPIVKEVRKCKWCDHKFETTNKSKKKCCSLSCASKYREFLDYEKRLNAATSDADKIKIQFRKYRLDASFTFSLKDFPDEFDFQLIETYGWYKAKNRGNNLGGVSRDHMYSVKDGFLNGIDPKIIAHPANCRLIRQGENASKKNKSCITLEQLLERIKVWDEKYNK